MIAPESLRAAPACHAAEPSRHSTATVTQPLKHGTLPRGHELTGTLRRNATDAPESAMVSTRAAQERLSTGYRIAVPLLFPEQRSHQRRAADSFPARHLHAGTRPATVRHKATTAPELTLPRSGSITSGHSALFDRGRMRESPPMLCQGEERLGQTSLS